MSLFNLLEKLTVSLAPKAYQSGIKPVFDSYDKDSHQAIVGGINHFQKDYLVKGDNNVKDAAINSFMIGIFVALYAQTPAGKEVFEGFSGDVLGTNLDNVVDIMSHIKRRNHGQDPSIS